jgi:hypothetical protein
MTTTKPENWQGDKGALRIANKELQMAWAQRKSWKSLFFQGGMPDIVAKMSTTLRVAAGSGTAGIR